MAYITKQIPWGKNEAFIIDEMHALKDLDHRLFVFPRNPPTEMVHKEAADLVENAKWLPGISVGIIIYFLLQLLYRPKIWFVIFKTTFGSRSINIALKNLAVLPKAVYVAPLLKKQNIAHIHVHWGATTATMGYIISVLTQIPWSMTLHRVDIAENNLLKIKANSASFIRVIARDGQEEFLRIVGDDYRSKTHLVHMGSNIDKICLNKFGQGVKMQSEVNPTFRIICPAFFEIKKGHRYLIEACKILLEKGIKNFSVTLIGDGPLQQDLKKQVNDLGLDRYITFSGLLPHEHILNMYAEGLVDSVVLPSIIDQDGEREGIPVSLIEAMTYSIPVISTITGGIPELLDDGAGLLVDEKNPIQLSKAIEDLINDKQLAYNLGIKGYERIVNRFNVTATVSALVKLMEGSKIMEAS